MRDHTMHWKIQHMSFAFAKLFIHNTAEHSPTELQPKQTSVLSHTLARWATTTVEWNGIVEVEPAMLLQRKSQYIKNRRKVAEWWKRTRNKQITRMTRNERAAVAVPKKCCHGKVLKRHTFNKVRRL